VSTTCGTGDEFLPVDDEFVVVEERFVAVDDGSPSVDVPFEPLLPLVPPSPLEGPVGMVPNKELCRRILDFHKVPTASIAHADMVERLASAIARCVARRYPGQVDAGLVTAGAMLHELGTAREKGLRYIMEGVGMAHRMGLHPRLIEVIRRHRGIVVGPMEAGRLGIPATDLSILGVEEWIVGHADLLIDGDQRLTAQQVAGRFRRAGLHGSADRLVNSHIRLSFAAGWDVDKLGPTGEMPCPYIENPALGLTKMPGRLLAVEDPTSVERKRVHRRADGKRWMAALGTPLLLLLGLSAIGGATEVFWFLTLLLGPPWLIVGLAKMEGGSHGLSGPLKVYENGVALKPPEGDYTFIPWGVSDVFTISDRGDLGRVLTVPLGVYTVEFLATMRDYDVVERVVRRKRVPNSRISVWGPGNISLD
jgi:uncharacterized protein